MPDLLSANLLAALKKETDVSAEWVIETDFVLTPGAAPTTMRWAGADVMSWGIGHFDGYVKADGFGIGRRAVALHGCELQISQTTVTLIETSGRFWSMLTKGPTRRQLPGSPVRIYLVSRDCPTFADNFLETNMVLFQTERQNDYEITLTLRPDTTLLDRAIPDLVLTEALYPFADPNVWGRYGTLLYGIWDSASTHGQGLLPAYPVNRNEFRYWAMIGKIEVTAVFVDGQPWTDWSAEYVRRGGYDVTEIVLTTDQEGKSVTFDARGYKDNAGVVITSWVSQQAHFLRNFGFGNPIGQTWHYGPWLSSSPMLHIVAGAGWLESHTYGFDRNQSGAAYLGASKQRTPLAALNEWSTSQQIKPFLKNNGKLDARLFNPARRRPTGDASWFRAEDVRSFKPKDLNAMCHKVQVAYHLDPVAGTLTKNAEVADPTVPVNKGMVPHEMPWGPVNEESGALLESAPDDV